MTERLSDSSDEALARRLAAELPRHAAPAHLRVLILEAAEPRAARPSWLPPLLAALTTAMVFVLGLLPMLPRTLPLEPADQLLRSAVAEHNRVLLWGARRSEVLPGGLPWLARESGITLRRTFAGDDRLAFVSAEPVYLDGRRGLALSYRDSDGHLVSYTVVTAPRLAMPARPRVQIDRWKPALVRETGVSALVWKQGDLACFLIADLVSDAELERLKDYFARVRATTEPVPAS